MRQIPKHPKGRPTNEKPKQRLTQRLVVYSDVAMTEKVNRIAKAQRISCSDVIRYAVRELSEDSFTGARRLTPVPLRSVEANQEVVGTIEPQ